jgi:hypothetical protein
MSDDQRTVGSSFGKTTAKRRTERSDTRVF